MIIRACELVEDALDWAVAVVEGYELDPCRPDSDRQMVPRGQAANSQNAKLLSELRYSTDWSQGGPLIDKYNLTVSSPKSSVHRHGGPLNGWGESGMWMACTWHKGVSGKRSFGRHETSPLIAACRAIVASELGDEVDVPDEIAQSGG